MTEKYTYYYIYNGITTQCFPINYDEIVVTQKRYEDCVFSRKEITDLTFSPARDKNFYSFLRSIELTDPYQQLTIIQYKSGVENFRGNFILAESEIDNELCKVTVKCGVIDEYTEFLSKYDTPVKLNQIGKYVTCVYVWGGNYFFRKQIVFSDFFDAIITGCTNIFGNSMTTISDFFYNYTNPVTNNNNFLQTATIGSLAYARQLNDIKENYDVETSFKDLMYLLYKFLNVKWDIYQGKIRIEHISFWYSGAPGYPVKSIIDVTQIDSGKYLSGKSNYKYNQIIFSKNIIEIKNDYPHLVVSNGTTLISYNEYIEFYNKMFPTDYYFENKPGSLAEQQKIDCTKICVNVKTLVDLDQATVDQFGDDLGFDGFLICDNLMTTSSRDPDMTNIIYPYGYSVFMKTQFYYEFQETYLKDSKVVSAFPMYIAGNSMNKIIINLNSVSGCLPKIYFQDDVLGGGNIYSNVIELQQGQHDYYLYTTNLLPLNLFLTIKTSGLTYFVLDIFSIITYSFDIVNDNLNFSNYQLQEYFYKHECASKQIMLHSGWDKTEPYKVYSDSVIYHGWQDAVTIAPNKIQTSIKIPQCKINIDWMSKYTTNVGTGFLQEVREICKDDTYEIDFKLI